MIFYYNGESVVKIPLGLFSELDLIRAVHKRYEAKRTSTLTFFVSNIFVLYGSLPNSICGILINATQSHAFYQTFQALVCKKQKEHQVKL